MTDSPAPVNPYAAADASENAPNAGARASFVIAVVLVVIAVVLQVTNQFVPLLMVNAGWSTTQVGILFAVIGFINLALAAAGVVFGLVGIRRPGLTLQAGIGLGVGGFVAITSLVGLIASPLVGLLYSL